MPLWLSRGLLGDREGNADLSDCSGYRGISLQSQRLPGNGRPTKPTLKSDQMRGLDCRTAGVKASHLSEPCMHRSFNEDIAVFFLETS
jgi:hypothetical protein